MRVPQADINNYCDEIEQFQRKLCLKDNGTNTEEILFCFVILKKRSMI